MRIRFRSKVSNTNRPQTHTLRLPRSQGMSYKYKHQNMYNSNYIIPIKLLEKQSDQDVTPNDDVVGIKRDVLTVLKKYGIEVERMESIVSPSIITIVAVPSQGYKLSKIRKYAEDIERDLRELGTCRVTIPLPGRNAFAAEVPRPVRRMICLREVLETPEFKESKAVLPIALGISTENEPVIADLSKMPHLLIGGAIGSGKSLLLHSIIVSLLYKMRPDELKFVLIDPKMIEFPSYSKIKNQYLAKFDDLDEDIITSPLYVVQALNALRKEMDRRFEMFKSAGCRNIQEYNRFNASGCKDIQEYNQKITNGNWKGKIEESCLPYIVVIIDEYAALQSLYGKEFETHLLRLVAKCRAVGIHVIITTQQASTKVITGILKASFPARIAFKVNNISDSKTILDMTGAQMLTGGGDMLRTDNGWISRIQGAFVDSQDIEKVCDWIARYNSDNGSFILHSPSVSEDMHYNPCKDEGADPLFEEAARIVIQSGVASTSALQRRYSIGYNRACRIMDQLEQAGIVGSADNGRPRKVLLSADSDSQKFPSMTNRFLNKVTQFCKRQREDADLETLMKFLGESKATIPYEDYDIIGNVSEIQKIISTPGIINISKGDLLSSLTSSGRNYVTTGFSNEGIALDALLDAVIELRKMTLDSMKKILFNIWVNSKNRKLSSAEMTSIVGYCETEFQDAEIIWGVAHDTTLDIDNIKVTLIASE